MKKKRARFPLGYSVFEFPLQTVCGGVNVCIYENIGASVDNYGSICNYSDNRLCLKTKAGYVVFEGERLTIVEGRENVLMISGCISSVVFDYRNT